MIFFDTSSFFPIHRIVTDINECEMDNGNFSNGTCAKTNESFSCSYHKGYDALSLKDYQRENF